MHSVNDIKIAIQLFLHCPNFHAGRKALWSNIRKINEQILSEDNFWLTHLLLYGNSNFDLMINRFINEEILWPTPQNFLFEVHGRLKVFRSRRQERLFLYRIMTVLWACVNRKRMCYDVLIFYPDSLHSFEEINHEKPVLKTGALKI